MYPFVVESFSWRLLLEHYGLLLKVAMDYNKVERHFSEDGYVNIRGFDELLLKGWKSDEFRSVSEFYTKVILTQDASGENYDTRLALSLSENLFNHRQIGIHILAEGVFNVDGYERVSYWR